MKKLDKSIVPILPECYLKPLIRTWLMKNHKGYQDGFQLEFWCNDAKPLDFLQIQAISSHLIVYQLKKLA